MFCPSATSLTDRRDVASPIKQNQPHVQLFQALYTTDRFNLTVYQYLLWPSRTLMTLFNSAPTAVSLAVQEHAFSPQQLVDLNWHTCVGHLCRVGCLLCGAAVVVQFYLKLPYQVIFGVQLQLQLIDKGISLSQLLDLQLQSQLKVPQGATALRHSCHAQTMQRTRLKREALRI